MNVIIKAVDEETFKKCVDEMLSGRMHPDVAAYLCGLSRATFNKRVNQYYDPEKFGNLPEGFFGKSGHKVKETPEWTKASAAIRKYKEREEERKQRQRLKELHEQYLKERDTFRDAKSLPKLEE